MGTTANKLSYLRETKSLLKDKIIDLGGTITDETTFEEYAEEVADLYNELPKTIGEGSKVILKNCLGGKLEIQAKGNTTQAALPSEYQAVEYIESTGTQHIDTGINADNKLRVWLDMQYTGFPYDNINFGAIVTSPSIIRYHMSIQSTSLKPFFNTTSYTVGTRDTNRHIIDMNPSAGIFSLDGVNTTVGSASFNVGMNFWLFGRNSNADIYHSNMKLYRCKMYYNGILVRDFIPCYKTADTTIGLYDLVNNVFYANIGEGVFTKGNDVTIPNPDYPIDIKVATGNNIITITGKNLSEIDRGAHSIPYTASGLTYNFNKNTITVTGTRVSSGIGESYIFKKQFKTGSYTISGLPNKEVGNSDRATVYIWYNTTPNAGLSNADETIANCFGTKTITLSQDGYVGFRIISQGDAVGESLEYNQTYNIQIEEGTEATSFEEYRAVTKNLNLGNIELCKIDTYQDYIYKNNNNWYKKEIITKQYLNDVTGWWFGNVSYRIYAEKSGQCIDSVLPYCDYLKGCTTSNIINTGGLALQNLTNKIRFNCYITEFDNDINAFKSWLATANPVCYYVKVTATNTQITDTTLIEQLEVLSRTIIPNGTIVVSAGSDSNNADLQVLASTVRSKEV